MKTIISKVIFAIFCLLFIYQSAKSQSFNNSKNQTNASVTFQVTTNCNENSLGTKITLYQTAAPFNNYVSYCDSLGNAVFDSIVYGNYEIKFQKADFDIKVLHNYSINEDININAQIEKQTPMLSYLYVNPYTSEAKWEKTFFQALIIEDFEGDFIPPKWSSCGGNVPPYSWKKLNEFNECDGWGIPYQYPYEYSSWYTASLTICDIVPMFVKNRFLVTPPIDLTIYDSLTLVFDSYLDGCMGHDGFIYYAYDSASIIDTSENYNDLFQVEEKLWWNTQEYDISNLCGEENGNDSIYFVFNSEDYNSYTSGWAIDNVSINSDSAFPNSYCLYLNDSFIDTLPNNSNKYIFPDLIYGQTYKVQISANYDWGSSEKKEYTWVSKNLPKPRNLSLANKTNDTVEFNFLPPKYVLTDSIPKALTAYKVYRKGEPIKYIVHDSTFTPESIISFTDTVNLPGWYKYEISAIYDASYYDTLASGSLESVKLMSDPIEISWGRELPFIEDWSSGDLDFNNWQTDSISNWKVDLENGNLAPSLMFTFSPINKSPNQSIESDYIYLERIDDQQVYFQFDIKKQIMESASQRLEVEYLNSEGMYWSLLKRFEANHFDTYKTYKFILDLPADQSFTKIRFTATGNYSESFNAWYIDNIIIDKKVAAPINLWGDYFWDANDDFGAKIDWDLSNFSISRSVHWKQWYIDLEEFSAYHIDQRMTVACGWDPVLLKNFTGKSISKTRFYLVENNDYEVIAKIWKGDKTPEDLVFSKQIPDSLLINEQYVEFPLDTNIIIDNNKQLWIGFEFKNPKNNDSSFINIGYVHLYYPQELLFCKNYYQDYKWNHNEEIAASFGFYYSNDNQRELNGFNLYKKINSEEEYTLYDYIPYEYGKYSYSYVDSWPNVNINEYYRYRVTAEYQNDSLVVESDPAKQPYPLDLDYVYIYITSMGKPEKNNVNISPNPATNVIKISSEVPLVKLEIFSVKGDKLLNKNINYQSFTENINLSADIFKSGLYIIKIHTENQIHTFKFVKSY